MAKKKYDFGGWATRFNVRCSDGRTIKKQAFIEQDGQEVPLVWNHDHASADNVLGHALLELRDEGMYAYGSFNDSPQGIQAKELVRHGDITSLSIFANQLKQNGGDVMHGSIREVSLVLAGANPGARIENVIAHGEEINEMATIFNAAEGLEFDVELQHADDNTKEETKKEDDKMPQNETKEKTVQDVIDTMNEEQKAVLNALLAAAMEEAEKGGNDDDEEDDKEKETMKHNAFDNQSNENRNTLSHADIMATIESAKNNGKSLRDAFNSAYLAHGVNPVEVLYPEATNVTKTPEKIERDLGWVAKVMNGVTRTPFSRIKSTAVNLKDDELRAKGYLKGDRKKAAVITALKRSTTPTTIYKKQEMDRDDILDITDFDVVSFLKTEMHDRLDEEKARAILLGDGRNVADEDKIDELHIRPILGDDELYTISEKMTMSKEQTDEEFAKDLIKHIIKTRKKYKGSGNPTLFTTEDVLTSMLLIEDLNQRVIYDSVDKLKTVLRVKDIVTVEVMEGNTREANGIEYETLAILVNLADYKVGADKGAATAFFEDFDIDFNKEKYLLETRMSGALTKPFSAIAYELKIGTVE